MKRFSVVIYFFFFNYVATEESYKRVQRCVPLIHQHFNQSLVVQLVQVLVINLDEQKKPKSGWLIPDDPGATRTRKLSWLWLEPVSRTSLSRLARMNFACRNPDGARD